MATTAALSEAEVKGLVDDWYKGLDVHAPTVDMLPLVAEEGLFMRFPEADLEGLAAFDNWYNGVIRIFFDEVHTMQELNITLNADKTESEVKLVVRWEASRWKPPAAQSERLMFDAYQTWIIRRSPQSGKPVITKYMVDDLRPLPGSVPL